MINLHVANVVLINHMPSSTHWQTQLAFTFLTGQSSTLYCRYHKLHYVSYSIVYASCMISSKNGRHPFHVWCQVLYVDSGVFYLCRFPFPWKHGAVMRHFGGSDPPCHSSRPCYNGQWGWVDHEASWRECALDSWIFKLVDYAAEVCCFELGGYSNAWADLIYARNCQH